MEGVKKTVLVAQDNALTQSKQPFSVIQKRCLYGIIEHVRKVYIDNPQKKGQKDLFENMYITMQASYLQKLGDETKDVYKALKNLCNIEFEVETEDKWIYTHWVLTAEHEKKKNEYTILVSREIMPYLVELAENFTVYDITVAIALKSTYSQRFYELCCQYKNRACNKFFLSVEDIREMFMIKDKYKLNTDFKRRVLDTAQKELQELYEANQSELYFTYSEKAKEGKRVTEYWFEIHNRDKKMQAISNDLFLAHGRRTLEIIGTFIKKDKEYLKRVAKWLEENPNRAMELHEKLENKVLNYDKKGIAPIIRYVLKMDFGIV